MKCVLRSCVLLFAVLAWTGVSVAQLPNYLGDERVLHIPFRYEANFIIVQTKLGGIPMNFIFDTGAEHSLLLKRSYFDLLGLPIDRKVKIFGSDLKEHRYAHIVRNVPIQLQNAPLSFEDMLVMDEDYTVLDELSGVSIDGIIGASIFKSYVVKIDYRRQRISLYRDGGHKLAKKGYTAYPMQLHKSKPYVTAQSHFTVRDSAELMLLLDTGAGIGLMLHSNSHDQIKVPEQYVQTQLGMGLGGQITGFMGRVDRLKLQQLSLNGVITGFQEVDQFALKDASFVRNGILGNQILSRFTIIIDYPSSALYLKPHRKYDRDFPFDRSGLTLMASGVDRDEYAILHVQPGSPAEAAGLIASDQVLRINGKKTKYLSLDRISRLLRKEVGKRIKLTIIRDGVQHDVAFLLKDLI